MNIVFILTDDQEVDSVNSDTMPYLASQPEGHWVQLPNSVQTTPLCNPIRATLLTGQRCDSHGITGNTGQFTESTGIAPALQSAGVTTGLIGKYTNDYIGASYVPAGWDRFLGLRVGEASYFTGYEFYDDTAGVVDATDFGGAYVTDVLADEAVAFIDASAADPFFLFIPTTAPHYPSTPPTRYESSPFTIVDPPDWNETPENAPSWLQAFSAMGGTDQTNTRAERVKHNRTLLAVDDLIEDVITALSSNEILDDTIVIFCTDNAFAYGRKRIGHANRVLNKRSPYTYASSGLMRVRHPSATQRTDTRMVDFVDIPAAILDNFGATPLAAQAGQDFMPVVLDTADSWRDVTFSLYTTDERPEIPKWRNVRSEQWRCANYYEDEEVELYDLTLDPHERVNVAAQYPEIIAQAQAAESAILADPLAAFTVDPMKPNPRVRGGGNPTGAAIF